MDEDKERPKARFTAELKAQFKAVLRITGLMLCCAVLFMSGFYLGIYQGGLDQVPEGGIITGTYTPSDDSTSALTLTPSTTAAIAPDAATVPAAATTPATSTSPDATQEPAVAPPTPEELLAALKWPVDGKISTEPGWVFSGYLNQWVYFSGVEISCETGAAVVAALAGSVRTVAVDPMLGTMVTLQHDSGLETTYGRVLGASVRPGDEVAQGDAIGRGGSDGVYFSITCQGEPLSARECLATAK